MQHHKHHAGMWHGEHDGERWSGRMAEQLGLSEDQQSQIKAIHEAARAESEPLRKQYREARQAEQEAFRAGAGESELKALAARAAESRVDMMLQGRATHDKVHALLTPEQQAKMETLKAERKAKGEARKEKWRERKESGRQDAE